MSKFGELSFFSYVRTTRIQSDRRYNDAMIAMEIVLWDMLADVLMILLAQRLAGMRPRLRFVLAGALFGAIAAALMRAMHMTRGAQAALWMPLAMGISAIATAGQARRRIVRDGVLLLCAAGLMGGIVQALAGATGSLGAAYALGLTASAGIAVTAVRSRRAAMHVLSVQLTVVYRGRHVSVEAMTDSGNVLRDYLTHRPVIVLPQACAGRLFAAGQAGLRPIFADTAGGRTMMWCFTPDEVTARIGARRVRLDAAAAFAPGMAGMALLPQALIEARETGGNGAMPRQGEGE